MRFGPGGGPQNSPFGRPPAPEIGPRSFFLKTNRKGRGPFRPFLFPGGGPGAGRGPASATALPGPRLPPSTKKGRAFFKHTIPADCAGLSPPGQMGAGRRRGRIGPTEKKGWVLNRTGGGPREGKARCCRNWAPTNLGRPRGSPHPRKFPKREPGPGPIGGLPAPNSVLCGPPEF